ncbi:MAG: hypothetical protein U1E76_05895 [Planctomycetota bacterium]
MTRDRAAWEPWCLLAIVALGAAVRWRMMGDGLDYDECQHFLVARSPLLAEFLRECRLRAHPPLAYLPIKLILELGTTAALAKLASLLSGLLGIVLSHVVLKHITGSRLAPLGGALLVALMPQLVAQSVEVRHYSLGLVFIWSSFALFVRIARSGTVASPAAGADRWRDHLTLAVLQFLAISTIYSAAFHALALSLVLYVPLAGTLGAQRQWRRLFTLLAPQLLPALVTLLALSLPFEASVARYGHTGPYLYRGSFTDWRAILYHSLQSIERFLAANVPAPFGWAAGAAVLLGACLPAGPNLRARLARAIAIYGVLALLLSLLASLLGKFPLGGVPRHNLAIVPGLFLAALLQFAAWLERLPHARLRLAAAALLVAAFAAALVTGLAPVLRDRENYDDPELRWCAAEYARAPGPIVANWRGRSVISWWLLRRFEPRLVAQAATGKQFQYDHVQVSEVLAREAVLATALAECQRSGTCWIALCDLPADLDELHRTRASLAAALAAEPGIDLAIDTIGKVRSSVLIMKLVRRSPQR